MTTTRHAEIAGAGLGGLALAIALAQKGWTVRVHERSDELRMFGAGIWLWENGLRALAALGVEEAATARARRITTMVARDQDGRALLRRNFGTEDRLVLPPRADLYDALIARVEELGVDVEVGSTAVGITPHGELEIEGGKTFKADLVVAADGAQSTLRTAAGVSAQSWDYEQVAVIANVYTQRFHDHVAYERFTSAGPIAMLPITDGRCGLIWTFAKDEADRWAECPDEEFLARLQEAFGFRLGRITRVGTRHKYPLALTRSDDHIAERLAIVGNAAQALHPIAGQGFNLGLRDAASLAEILAEAREQTSGELDVGDGLWLQRYRAWREADRSNIVRFTDGLVRLFTQPFGPVQVLRDFGLLAFDLVTPAKHALAQLSLGAAGRVPRLTRGVPLRHAH